MSSDTKPPLPPVAMAALRGVGQVFFQENALTGVLFLAGIAVASPLMAAGALLGTVIGTAIALLLKFDAKETAAGIFGFNPTLVGIAVFAFFQPTAAAWVMVVVGCAASTFLTRAMRTLVPFPTYTLPFIVTTWALFLLGPSLGAVAPVTEAFVPPEYTILNWAESFANGISQVMFQENLITAILFVVGIAVENPRHAALVVLGTVVGKFTGTFHFTQGDTTLNPELLVLRDRLESVRIGLYGFNATLVAIALYLWRPGLIAPLLGMLLTVPLLEIVPLTGVPALTSPFVFAAWIVIAIGRLETYFAAKPAAA